MAGLPRCAQALFDISAAGQYPTAGFAHYSTATVASPYYSHHSLRIP
eukprot:COSAG04_NODE_30985_length_259_cov_0.943750_1_plen_46_part_01